MANVINNAQDAQGHFTPLANSIIDDETGKALEYCQLIKKNKH